MDLLVKN